MSVRGRRASVGRRSIAERAAEHRDARADGDGHWACDGAGNELGRGLDAKSEIELYAHLNVQIKMSSRDR